MQLKTFDLKFFLAVVVLCLSNIFTYTNVFSTPFNERASTKEFPSKISGWVAKDVVYDNKILRVLAPDKTIYKTYQKDGSQPITLFMAYYNTLEKADLSHSPIVCFTGQGWDILKSSQKEMPVNLSGTERIKVNQLIQKKLDTLMITLFWYQSADSAFSNRGIQKISLFVNRLIGEPNCNSFVRVTINVPRGGSEEKTLSELYAFVQDLYPELKKFFL